MKPLSPTTTLVLHSTPLSRISADWLERELPSANRLCVDTIPPKGGLQSRFWDAIVAVDALPATAASLPLRAFLCALPARRRYILDSGELIPWGLPSEANLLWRFARTRLSRSDHGYGNDFRFIRPSKPSDLRVFPSLSVVVPVYNRREHLARTLAALSHQNYPRERFEVIVADDGSSDAPESLHAMFADRLRLRWVRQEDDGYRLAAVRNKAIGVAENEVIVSLDCDMMPVPDFLAAHARWFETSDRSLIVAGDRSYVDADGLRVEELLGSPEPLTQLPQGELPNVGRLRWLRRDWRHLAVAISGSLALEPVPYLMCSGGNVSFRRKDAERIGGYDEAFKQWGGEDNDFAYRLIRECGAYVIFDALAHAYHQNHPESVPREEHRRTTRGLLGERIPRFKRYRRSPAINPEISVYMPAHNCARWITTAINSVLTQNFHDVEVCVFDDGSTDETPTILERFGRSDPRVRFERGETARGIAYASSRAVAMCRGEFIAQLDADDEFMPTAIGRLVRELRADPKCSLVITGYVVIDKEGREITRRLGKPVSVIDTLTSMPFSHARAFRARDYNRIRGFDESLESAVDYDFYLQLSRVGRVKHIPRILYRYRMHGKNITIQKRRGQIENHRRVSSSAIRRFNPSYRLKVIDANDTRRDRVVDGNGRVFGHGFFDQSRRGVYRLRSELLNVWHWCKETVEDRE